MRPAAEMVISHTMQSRSTCGLSRQRPLESTSGSMGTTEFGEVDGVAALVGLGVEGCARFSHEAETSAMATHRRQPPPPLASRRRRHRSRGIFPVDGNQRQGAQVDATLFGLLRHLLAETGDLLVTSSGQVCGMPWVRRGNLDLHAGAMFSPSTSQYGADRVGSGQWRAG